MSQYSQLPIYNSVFLLLKDLYERVPKFAKQYKYLLGEKMLDCCVSNILLITQISEEKENEKRIILISKIAYNTNNLLTYTRIANELNQFGKESVYFFLSEKILNILDQTENWKKFLQKK
jgi:hypothetical protein